MKKTSAAAMPAGSTVEATQGYGKRSRLTATGAVLSAIGASSCCILPLALFSVGAGGAWIGNLTALAPYQPAFVTAGAGFLGYGFYSIYRKPKTACADGTTCGRSLPNRAVKTGLWGAMALIIAAMAFPYVAPWLLGV